MHRSDFLKLVTAGSALSTQSISSVLGHSVTSDSVTSFPIKDWQAVVNEGWGTKDAEAGPGTWDGVSMKSPEIPDLDGDGPFKPSWKSLLNYDAPEWYKDAKFGIWAHWDPQCVPEDGDWYARNMYIQGDSQYEYHVKRFGPQSRFGYKDLCAQWTMLNWEPEYLMERFQQAGARVFMALANHHDGFDTWNSKYHPWNAQNMGPRRDVIGGWAAAARSRGIRFGVSVHAARNWWWFQVAHLCDKTGPFKGIPYDGHLKMKDGQGQWWQGYDPQLLYGRKHGINENPDRKYVFNFYNRVRDLIDQHNPDVLLFDNGLPPLGWAGLNLSAYYYNKSLAMHGGDMQAVINVGIPNNVPKNLYKAFVGDLESGLTDRIMPYPWQSEVGIGSWHYARSRFINHTYMKPEQVIHWMVDAVSKNGFFLLNIPGRPDGTIDTDEESILDEIGKWMYINGEAIYATRPWKIYGEGPHKVEAGQKKGHKGTRVLDYRDIRFTRNKRGNIVYAIVLGWPEEDIEIKSFGRVSSLKPGKIANVEMLGSEEKLNWSQKANTLLIKKPYFKPCDYACICKIIMS